MPYDESLAERIEGLLSSHKSVIQKRMFGGLTFMLHGNMCCGVLRDRLMVRLGAEGSAAALQGPDTEPITFTGKPMKNMVFVTPAGYESDEALEKWVAAAVRFVKTLPPK